MIALAIILIGLMAFAVTWGTSLIKRPEPTPEPAPKSTRINVPLESTMGYMRHCADLPARKSTKIYLLGQYIGTLPYDTDTFCYMALNTKLIKAGIDRRDVMLVGYFTPLYDSDTHFLQSYHGTIEREFGKEWKKRAYQILPDVIEACKRIF